MNPRARAMAKRVIYLRARLRRRFRPDQLGLTSRKLHLGCGDLHISGWCNVDVDSRSAADVQDDITKLAKFSEGYADEMYACHVLEHLSHEAVPVTLRRWRSVLRDGGILRVSVPDMDRIVKTYVENWDHFQTHGNAPWIGLIYGGQDDQYDFHKTGFNFVWMRKLLQEAGFSEIREYPHEPHFLGVSDASLANQPFGVYLSLNVVAVAA